LPVRPVEHGGRRGKAEGPSIAAGP